MQISVQDIATLLNGHVEGDGSSMLNALAKIEEGKLGALAFLANPKYEDHLYQTLCTAVLVGRNFVATKNHTTTLIRVDDPYAAFSLLLEKFSHPDSQLVGLESMSFVHPKTTLGKDVYIGAFAYVSEGVQIGDGSQVFPHVYLGANVKIGKNCILYSGVKIYHDCEIGNNCIVHASTVIGADGFGFAPLPDRSYKKIPQIGNVIIEDEVEIGSNCSIDRATMGSTIIRNGVKLDNLIQVAHNVEIGEHTVIAGQSGVAGSAKVGRFVVVGGQVAISGHTKIADGNQFGGKSGVQASITEENKKWFGVPVMEVKDALRSMAIYRHLPEMMKRIEELEKEIKRLKAE